jgi:hemerythrin-like domain-containing protein
LVFLKEFADRCHHGKEEDFLFPALEKAGIKKEGGPI